MQSLRDCYVSHLPAEPRKHPTSNDCPKPGPWMLDVGCWALDVPLRFRVSKREAFTSGYSLPISEPRKHPTSNDCPKPGPWMLDVGCWALDVPLRFRVSKREAFTSGYSLP